MTATQRRPEQPEGPAPPRVTHTRPQQRPAEPREVQRLPSFPRDAAAETHQQVGAAIISLRHRPRGAASVSASRRPEEPPSDTRTATPTRGHAPQTAYIGRPRFPTAPATLAPHWTDLAQPEGERDQLLPSAWLEIEVTGERGAQEAGTQSSQSAARSCAKPRPGFSKAVERPLSRASSGFSVPKVGYHPLGPSAGLQSS